MLSDHSILLTIDVEDWFQVENFKQCIPFSTWSRCELRVEKNTHSILDLLDSIKLKNFTRLSGETCLTGATKPDPDVPSFVSPAMSHQPSAMSHRLGYRCTPKATFFILGLIAQRLPHLVREIRARGHEVASHGYYHNLCNQQSPDTLKKDLADSKKLLEDIIGVPVYGYRAPSFSVNADILKIIEACGYLYDSSFNSFRMHGRYGQVDLSNHRKNGIAAKISDFFYELPISNLRLGNHIFPWGGGGYFRLIPLLLFRLGVQSILEKEKAYLLYLHPWEIDPEQPRVKEASRFYRFRHYINLEKTLPRLSSLIETFSSISFVTCRGYLETKCNHLESKK